ncbi:hypothetical protein COOONC_09225 [Cooperia oncophora]
MPPKKSNGCNNCKDAVIPLWLKSVLKRWDYYFARFDRMFDLLVSMQQSHRSIVRKIDAIENRLFDQMSAAQANSDLYTTKQCNIVWVGIEEQVDDRSTSDFDREAIKEIIYAACDNELMSQWKAGNIKTARFPHNRSATLRKPRIIKINLPLQELRDRLLAFMKRGRLSLTQTFPHSYARRDYTKEELDYDRQLRKRAGLLSANGGKLLYVVRALAGLDKTPRSPRSISRSSSIEGQTYPGRRFLVLNGLSSQLFLDYIRDLGVSYDASLDFERFITDIVTEAIIRSSSDLITSCVPFTRVTLSCFYVTINVRPMLEYCSQLRSPYKAYLIDRVEQYQEQVFNLSGFYGRKKQHAVDSYERRLTALGALSLGNQVGRSRTWVLYKIVFNEVDLAVEDLLRVSPFNNTNN